MGILRLAVETPVQNIIEQKASFCSHLAGDEKQQIKRKATHSVYTIDVDSCQISAILCAAQTHTLARVQQERDEVS